MKEYVASYPYMEMLAYPAYYIKIKSMLLAPNANKARITVEEIRGDTFNALTHKCISSNDIDANLVEYCRDHIDWDWLTYAFTTQHMHMVRNIPEYASLINWKYVNYDTLTVHDFANYRDRIYWCGRASASAVSHYYSTVFFARFESDISWYHVSKYAGEFKYPFNMYVNHFNDLSWKIVWCRKWNIYIPTCMPIIAMNKNIVDTCTCYKDLIPIQDKINWEIVYKDLCTKFPNNRNEIDRLYAKYIKM